ncbi:hypothetical protein HMPREF9371_1090 [Neisseria shayeganii 871]|uniref:Uncharacterized protein n=1 Tax=Neisseria shayeganii 871 TaxID=1032488 RepID=G4CHK1_9NEIS|nr:hypothetical protein HMPREF9371_1090 [Neisseria shayeganii 871]
MFHYGFLKNKNRVSIKWISVSGSLFAPAQTGTNSSRLPEKPEGN